MYTLLEVPGKEDLEPLTLGYYQDKHYRSLRKKRQDTFGEELLQEYQKTCKDCGKIMDEKMLEKHIVNHHLKKKCCFCAEKLLKKEVEEHMDTVHKKDSCKVSRVQNWAQGQNRCKKPQWNGGIGMRN